MSQASTSKQAKRNQLILEYYPMVRRIAYRMVSRYPSSVEVDDLITIGTMGLMDAVDRLDEKRSISFTAYAQVRIQGAILDELRRQDWVPRSVRKRAKQLKRAHDLLHSQLGRSPTEQEWAKFMNLSVERLRELLRTSEVRSLISLEQGSEEDDSIAQNLQAETPTPAEIALRQDTASIIREVLTELSERDRRLIELYYFQEYSFAQIAKIFGITESRVSQLHSRIKRRLNTLLESYAMAA